MNNPVLPNHVGVTFCHENLGIAFVAIPKVGCSTIKQYLLDFLGLDTSQFSDVHRAAESLLSAKRFGTGDLPPGLLREIVAVVRDPRDRLRSGYIEKIVRPDSLQGRPGESLLSSLGNRFTPDEADHRRVTFREFVEFVCANDPDFLDEHWRPQSSFVESLPRPPAMIVRLEHLNEMLAEHSRIRGHGPTDIGLSNVTRKEPAPSNLGMACADVPGGELHRLNLRPTIDDLMTVEIEAQIADRLAADDRMFHSAPTSFDAVRFTEIVQRAIGQSETPEGA